MLLNISHASQTQTLICYHNITAAAAMRYHCFFILVITLIERLPSRLALDRRRAPTRHHHTTHEYMRQRRAPPALPWLPLPLTHILVTSLILPRAAAGARAAATSNTLRREPYCHQHDIIYHHVLLRRRHAAIIIIIHNTGHYAAAFRHGHGALATIIIIDCLRHIDTSAFATLPTHISQYIFIAFLRHLWHQYHHGSRFRATAR